MFNIKGTYSHKSKISANITKELVLILFMFPIFLALCISGATAGEGKHTRHICSEES